MARKSKFFTVKRSNTKSDMLFLHGKQVASIWRDGGNFCVFLLKNDQLEEFKTWDEAEYFAYARGF